MINEINKSLNLQLIITLVNLIPINFHFPYNSQASLDYPAVDYTLPNFIHVGISVVYKFKPFTNQVLY